MTIRVAINGYGRIGRNILRANYESGKSHGIEIVAINDLGNAETNAHLTQYDTAHGKFNGTVAVDGDSMVVNGDRIRVCAKRNPAELPWKALQVDVVLECTGFFTTKEKASAHIAAGAKKVIISAEEIVDEEIIRSDPNRTLIPEFIVHAVVEEPWCAHPSYTQGYYDRDNEFYVQWDEMGHFGPLEQPETIAAFVERTLGSVA